MLDLPAATGPSAIVVMGPSGCGKSTLGRALAGRLGWTFVEGDEHHPSGNRAKMKAGKPLTDADRVPFLKSVGTALTNSFPAVASCSALSSSHRDILRDHLADLLFVWPKTDWDDLTRRTEEREDHFMPPDLLGSQIATLDPPSPDERFLALDGQLPTSEQVDVVLRHLATLDR